MASTAVCDFHLTRLNTKDFNLDVLFNQVKQLERHTFPKDEAMDFDVELKKRNVELMIVLAPNEGKPMSEGPIAAYMLHARVHGVALLHKINVADVYQRRGIARSMISRLIANLESQGCQRISLWVDFQRPPAIGLYTTMGFQNTDRSRDYYGLGRHGLQMVYELNYIW